MNSFVAFKKRKKILRKYLDGQMLSFNILKFARDSFKFKIFVFMPHFKPQRFATLTWP